MLTSATVQITGGYQKGQDVLAFASTKKIRGKWDAKTGALTLSGTDTVANYQAALRAVKYLNTSENPSNAKRTVTLYVSDGKTNSNAVTRTAAVTPVNDPPVLAHIESKPLAYKEKQAATAVSTSVTVSDVDNPSLAGATVQITGNYKEGQDVLLFTSIPKTSITGTWDPQTGTMSLVGNDTVANYQKALRAVKYRTGTDPGTAARTVTFLANDGRAPSNALTRNITVKAMNDAPVLAGIEPTVLSYAKGQPATVITATITSTDVDNLTLASATVQITGGYKKGQDVLAFVNTATIAGTFDAKTGKLTLTGNDSVAAYQAALRAVTYQNVSATPSPAKRTVAFKVYDGAAYSKAATRTVQWATSAAASSATPLAPIQGAGPAANDTALLAMFWPLGSLGRPLGKAEGK
jgi:hypothetical protein